MILFLHAVWAVTPIFRGIGYAMFFMGTYVAIYYNMVIAWALYYLYASFTALPEVPWRNCGNPWNTDNCTNIERQNGSSTMAAAAAVTFNTTSTSPSQEYF